jgi:hypothetical protein
MHQPLPTAWSNDDEFVGRCHASIVHLPASPLNRSRAWIEGRAGLQKICVQLIQMLTIESRQPCTSGAATFLACAFTRGWLQRLLAISSKFGVAMAYNLAYIYTEEMFPTTVRNTALVRRPGGHRT